MLFLAHLRAASSWMPIAIRFGHHRAGIKDLDGGEDPGERSGSQQEYCDGRQLAGVALAEVGDGLDELAHHDHRNIRSLEEKKWSGSGNSNTKVEPAAKFLTFEYQKSNARLPNCFAWTSARTHNLCSCEL